MLRSAKPADSAEEMKHISCLRQHEYFNLFYISEKDTVAQAHHVRAWKHFSCLVESKVVYISADPVFTRSDKFHEPGNHLGMASIGDDMPTKYKIYINFCHVHEHCIPGISNVADR